MIRDIPLTYTKTYTKNSGQMAHVSNGHTPVNSIYASAGFIAIANRLRSGRRELNVIERIFMACSLLYQASRRYLDMTHSISQRGALLFCAFIACCATTRERQEITGARYEIDDIELKGVTRFEKDELLEYTFAGETSWLPFTETFYFNEALVPLDAQRIVALYHSHGYYDAEVVEIRAAPKRVRSNKVDLVISVHEGEPVRVTRIRYVWPDGPPQCPMPSCPTAETVETASRLSIGDPLEVPMMESTEASIERILKERGFALATAAVKATVDRDAKTAEVTVEIRPGKFAWIGEVRFLGLRRVPERLVLREVDGISGEPFSPQLLESIEQVVYAMDVFSAVEVVPGREIDAQGRMPITVVVTESKLQSIKVGVGLGFEPARWEERITGQYSHRNLFGELTRLDVRLRIGYAELPTPFTVKEHGPVLKVEPRLTKKGLLEKKLVWTAAPAFELGIDEGYQFYSPSTRLGVSRFFAQVLQVEVSHNFRFVDFFNLSETLDTNRSLLGLDFRDPYFLSYVALETKAYFTDRLFEPRNGIVLGARYAVAGGPFGGHYDYQKISPELRAYWQISTRVQVAARIETGYILPYGDRPAVPFDMKYYLGGADSVRGWGLKRLAPKTEICPPDEGEAEDCRRIPIGGKTVFLGNIELRVRTFGDLYAVAFGDAGDVQPDEISYQPDEWNYSAGGGLRYASPIGKFRLDVGARLNETPLSRGEARWAFHIGLGEAF
ncbi:MAG: BamA/TamA family outer membrane protein [Myxococcota bacterium]|nr:BamA/TamA family outer membrane protein [Myxococcota bacterium]